MITIAIITLLIFLVLGIPVSFTTGLSRPLTIVMGNDMPSFIAVQQTTHGMNSFSLMIGPLFVLAGEILGAAKLSKRTLDFCRVCISQLRGGLGVVSIMANMIFARISESGATIMGTVSTLTVPGLKKAGHDRAFITSMMAGSGALAPIIPSSTNMIVYASLTGFSVGKLLMGGVIPGLLIGFALTGVCYWYVRKYNVDAGTSTLDLHVVWKSFKDTLFTLITPIIIIAGAASDIFTITELSIIICFYALICGLFIYRTLRLKDLLGILKRATLSSAILMMTIRISNIYSYIFARENLTNTIKTLVLSVSTNPTVVVLIVIGIMLVIGCFIKALVTTTVILLIVYPLVMSLGVDLLMFGVLFSVTTIVGTLTPPVSLYLFLLMSIAKAPFKEAVHYTIPVVLIILVVMVLVLTWPPLVTSVSHLLMGI